MAKSRQGRLISQLCAVDNLDEDSMYYISRKLLEHYRSALDLYDGRSNVILKNDGKEEIRQWYLNLKQMPIDQMKEVPVDAMMFHVCRTDFISRVIDVVMGRVRNFPQVGELYYGILTRAYFAKEKMLDEAIATELNIDRSTLYRRKKEAILLCGIMLWEEAFNRKFG